MKALLVIVGLVLAASAGAVGGALCSNCCTARNVEALPAPTLVAPSPAAISPEAQKRMDSLSMEISDLQAQVAALRQEKSRAPAAPAAPELAAVAPESTDAFAAMHRDAILKVMADEQAEKDRKREEQQKLRDQQMLQARADRVAAKLNLSEGQKLTLVQFYGAERAKQDEMRAQFREAQDSGNPQPPRDAFRDAREWSTNELTRLFGTDLGAQIRDAEAIDRRPAQNGGGGGRRGGNGNGGNNGGGGNGPGAAGAGQSAPGGG